MSEYIGVYENRHKPTQADTPFRVAVKRYVNSKPEYTNIGYFKTEKAAAYIYNIFALNTFGKGAVINRVELTDEVEQEVEQFLQKREDFETLVIQATEIIEEYGYLITTHDELDKHS